MKVGIDLGGSHIAVGLVESNGNILSQKEVPILKEDEKNICNIIENFITTSVEEMTEFHKVDEIGLAIPGTVSKTKVIKSVNLGIENYDIIGALKGRFNIPIKIKNDAKCSAIAENTYGSIKQYPNSVFLTIGTGIGGAVTIGHKLICPDNVPGFEFGHMIIKQNGKLCKCGKRGCFEQYGSMRVFKEKVIEELELDENIDGKKLLEIVRKELNNPNIARIIDEYTTDLSVGISNLINIFEPEAIGIGGGFVYYADIFLPIIKDKILNSDLLFNEREDIIINVATLGNDAGIIGATLI